MTKIVMHNEFIDFMKDANETAEDMPDGAWWAYMQEQAELFIESHSLRVPKDGFEGVHYWLKHG